MRAFIAFDIENAVRERLLRFVDGLREFAPQARWVRPESFHITLKFIGEKPAETVDAIQRALSMVHFPKIDLEFRGYGFFPTEKTARVFWAGIEAGPQLNLLAKTLDDVTVSFGIPRETHAFSPHLTLARIAGGSGAPGRSSKHKPSQHFQLLSEALSARPAPEFGRMTVSEFSLYESKTFADGPHYTKIARFALS